MANQLLILILSFCALHVVSSIYTEPDVQNWKLFKVNIRIKEKLGVVLILIQPFNHSRKSIANHTLIKKKNHQEWKLS